MRVKSEVSAAQGDEDRDVVEDKLSPEKIVDLGKMLAGINDQYKEGLKEMEEGKGKASFTGF